MFNGPNPRDDFVGFGLFVTAVFSIFSPQAFTWLPAALALLMARLWPQKLSTGHPYDGVRAYPAVFALLTLFVLWTAVCTARATEPANALIVSGGFFFCAASAVAMILLPIRMGFNGRWAWQFFPLLHLGLMAGVMVFVLRLVDVSAIGGKRFAETWHYNRAAVLVALLLPLSLFAIRQMATTRRRFLLRFAPLYGLTGVVVFASESQSAQLAFLVMSLLHALAVVNIGLAVQVTGLGAAFVLMLTPLIFGGAYAWLHDSPLWGVNQNTVTERMLIWRSMLDYIWQSPWIGHGLEFVREAGNVNPETGTMMRPNHPHSFLFQVWVDAGLVGAAILSLLILSIAQMIRSIGGASGRMFITLMAGILTVWAVSHGMWQSWFVGMAGICCAYGAFMHQRSALVARMGLARDT